MSLFTFIPFFIIIIPPCLFRTEWISSHANAGCPGPGVVEKGNYWMVVSLHDRLYIILGPIDGPWPALMVGF